jgi:outer membrane murein-binding lipoprotein Lpp
MLVGAIAVTAGVVIAEQIRRQRKIEDVADLTDRLARQLESLEKDLSAARDAILPEGGAATNGAVKRKSSRSTQASGA